MSEFSDDMAEDEEEYVNEECPEQCSTEHDEPEPDDDGRWECPETGTVYTYCYHCGWERLEDRGRYFSGPVEVDYEWLCDPYEHGWTTCDGCGEWIGEDDARYSESRDGYYCNECYPSDSGSHVDARCDHCRRSNATLTHYHVITEHVYCRNCATGNAPPQGEPLVMKNVAELVAA